VIAPRIVVDERPDPDSREAIFRPLLDYNASKVGSPAFAPFAIFLRDSDTDEVIGGLWAHFVYGWLHVELLFVPEEMRGSGIGSLLMHRAEAVASERGCIGVWLDSFSFQAPGFYEKLGYEKFGTLDDFPRGEANHFLRKRLIPKNS
jgi:GNAT superfamily N-acetyltransferase